MKSEQVRSYVDRLFAGSRHDSDRIGVEHELLTADMVSGAVVPVARIREAAEGSAYAPHLAFEPGGQVELSLPPAVSASAATRELSAAVNALRADCERAGILLIEEALDQRRVSSVPLQLDSPRYRAMQERFDTFGPAGRQMMRRTASTQVCLDWWSGTVGLEQWRLLNLAGPFLAAAFARSTGPGSRLATWLRVDPERTAFDGRLLTDDDPVTAYTDFAMRAAVLTEPDDIGQHLTMLFPPVRPRGNYLETRFLDAQPLSAVLDVTTVLSTLMYDEEVRAGALRLVAGEESHLDRRWEAASMGDEEVTERGQALVRLAVGARPAEIAAAC